MSQTLAYFSCYCWNVVSTKLRRCCLITLGATLITLESGKSISSANRKLGMRKRIVWNRFWLIRVWQHKFHLVREPEEVIWEQKVKVKKYLVSLLFANQKKRICKLLEWDLEGPIKNLRVSLKFKKKSNVGYLNHGLFYCTTSTQIYSGETVFLS